MSVAVYSEIHDPEIRELLRQKDERNAALEADILVLGKAMGPGLESLNPALTFRLSKPVPIGLPEFWQPGQHWNFQAPP